MPAPVWRQDGTGQISYDSFTETIRRKKRPEHDVVYMSPQTKEQLKQEIREPSAFFWLEEKLDTVEGLDIVTVKGVPGAIIAAYGDLFPTVGDQKARDRNA